MAESQIGHFVVVLRQPIDSLLLCKVPDDDVRVLTSLTGSQEVTVAGDGEAGNLVVMGSQEMLVVRVLDVTDDDAASNDKKVLARTRVQMD